MGGGLAAFREPGEAVCGDSLVYLEISSVGCIRHAWSHALEAGDLRFKLDCPSFGGMELIIYTGAWRFVEGTRFVCLLAFKGIR